MILKVTLATMADLREFNNVFGRAVIIFLNTLFAAASFLD
jgi:hypothetical protein